MNRSICEKGITISLHIRELFRNQIMVIYETYGQSKDELHLKINMKNHRIIES